MVDPKFSNNNHLIDDLKDENNEENSIDKAISGYMKKDNGDQQLKEKMMKNLFIIAIITVIFVVVLFILSSVLGGSKSYSGVEDIMKKAATKYYQENSSLLPKTTGGIVEVSAQKLANLKYMKELDSYLKGLSCTGKVVVENNDDNYAYTAYLDCGDKYKTTELFRKVTASKNIVTTGNGLYVNGTDYLYKGDNVNNYVSLNDQLWRILKVNADNELVLIKQDKVSYDSYSWDDRFNSDKNYNVGINEFNISRIKDSLNTIYKDNDKSNEVKTFNKEIKNHIVSHSFCIGKRSSNTIGSDNSSECSVMSDSLKVGMLTVSDYMNASLDVGCTSALADSCQNYNYLVNPDMNWWLLTAVKDNSYQAYYVESNGTIKISSTVNEKKIRPVIYLNSKTMFKSGNGSLEKPYIIK